MSFMLRETSDTSPKSRDPSPKRPFPDSLLEAYFLVLGVSVVLSLLVIVLGAVLALFWFVTRGHASMIEEFAGVGGA